MRRRDQSTVELTGVRKRGGPAIESGVPIIALPFPLREGPQEAAGLLNTADGVKLGEVGSRRISGGKGIVQISGGRRAHTKALQAKTQMSSANEREQQDMGYREF